MPVNIHNYAQCCCIHNTLNNKEQCIKRTKYIKNLQHFSSWDCISVCNEYIRLLYHQKDEFYWMSPQIIVTNIWIKIISDVYSISEDCLTYKNNDYSKVLSEVNINIELCNRPLIYRSIKLVEAINLCLSNTKYDHLNSLIAHQISEWLKASKYQYYKSNLKHLLELSNRLKNTWDANMAELLINEILAGIIKQEAKQLKA